MSLIVQKYGGTSVGTVERIGRVAERVLARQREGNDVVYGVRQSREGETWFKLFTAKLFYRLIYRITNINIPLDTGDFRLMDRRVVDAIRRMPERNRFLRGMVPWVGFKQTGVEFQRQARYAGEAKFNSIRKMLPFAIDAITSFSYFPLQLATFFGFVCAALSAPSAVSSPISGGTPRAISAIARSSSKFSGSEATGKAGLPVASCAATMASSAGWNEDGSQRSGRGGSMM